jgi:hypothetical protein
MKHQPMCLAERAEAVLTDIVLRRLIAYDHLLGPYRPTRPLLAGVLWRVRHCLQARQQRRMHRNLSPF